MALQMSYTDGNGTVHGESYWIPEIQITKWQGNRTLRMLGFANRQARIDNFRPVGFMEIAISPEEFDTYFSPIALSEKDPYQASYDFIPNSPIADFFIKATNV